MFGDDPELLIILKELLPVAESERDSIVERLWGHNNLAYHG